MAEYRVCRTIENAHDEAVWCVSWRDQRIITGSASFNAHVKAWKTTPDAAFSVSPDTPVYAAQFSLAVVAVTQQVDGPAFASGTLNGTLTVFDTEYKAHVVSNEPGRAWGATFDPAGGPLLAATGQGGGVSIYDTSVGAGATQKMQSASKCCNSLAWSADGKLLAAGGTDGTATVFDARSGRRVLSVPSHAKAIRALRFTGDSNMLLTAGDDGCINVRDLAKGTLVASLTGHTGWVCALDTSAAAPRTLVSAGTDGTVRLWDLSINAHVHTFSEHHGQCWGVALNNEATKVACVADDKALFICSLA